MTLLRPAPDGTDLDVLVAPRASRTRIVGRHGDRLKVQVAAPPDGGAANDALVRFLARRLGVARRDVEIVAGRSSRRKTVRFHGAPPEDLRARLEALAGPLVLLLGLLAAGCEPASVEVDVTVVLPADTAALARTDNVSVAVVPDGPTVTSAVTGLDFSLDVAMDPTDVEQEVDVYLAEGTDLLGFGRSVRVPLAQTPALSVYVAPPDAVAALAGAPAVDDPAARAVRLRGFGALVVDAGGASWALDHRTFSILAAARAPFAPEEAPDLALASDALGGAMAVAHGDAPALFRYDPAADGWAELSAAGLDRLGDRPGAAALAADDGTVLFVFGGGARTDVAAVPLVPGDGGLEIGLVEGVALDDPRRGAVALWARGPGAGDDRAVLVGTEGAGPVVWVEDAGAAGPDGPWTNLACLPADPPAPSPTWPVTILCAGGLRGTEATADALLVSVSADGPAAVAELPAFLPTPMEAPVALAGEDRVAFYGEGLLVAVERGTTATQTVQDGLPRQGGGTSVTLATGTTIVVGGRTGDGASVAAWETFTPRPPGT